MVALVHYPQLVAITSLSKGTSARVPVNARLQFDLCRNSTAAHQEALCIGGGAYDKC